MDHTHDRVGLKPVLGLVFLMQAGCALARPITPSSQTTRSNTFLDAGSYFGPSLRGLGTALAMLSAVLPASTYSTLIGAGARTSRTKIPLLSIEQNIGAMLSQTWPNARSSVTAQESDISQDAIRLLYVGKMDKDERRVARGLRQSRASPEQPIYSPPL
jgi:hypothetical protein